MARPGPSRRCCVEKVWWPLASGAVCGHQWCRQRTRSPADQPGHSVRLVLTNHSPVSSGSIPGLTSPGRCHTLTFCPDTDVDTGDPSPAQPPVISGEGSYAPGCKLQYIHAQHTMKYTDYSIGYHYIIYREKSIIENGNFETGCNGRMMEQFAHIIGLFQYSYQRCTHKRGPYISLGYLHPVSNTVHCLHCLPSTPALL